MWSVPEDQLQMGVTPRPSIAYSCVIDAPPKFEWQAFLWLSSLLASRSCDIRDVRLHLLPGVSSAFRRLLERMQVACIEIEPFPGHPYCNKIQQCFSGAFNDHQLAVLTDCDLFFNAPPSLAFDATVAGRLVDYANPPLKILQRIYKLRKIHPSKVVRASSALKRSEKTLASNLNGGLYAVRTSMLKELGSHWREHAIWLIDHRELLKEFGPHVDQIAMALALDELEIGVTHVDLRTNFPLHLPEERLTVVNLPGIEVLHYHALMPPGTVAFHGTGLANIDCAIAHANAALQTILARAMADELFLAWYRERIEPSIQSRAAETR